MKEITPFLHGAIYQRFGKYPRMETFEQLHAALGPWMLTRTRREDLFAAETVRLPRSEPEPEPALTVVPPEQEPEEPEPEPSVDLVAKVADPDPDPVPPPALALPPARLHRFAPRKPDSLFWCIFAAHYGDNEYYQIEHKYMNRELEEKSRIMDYLKANPIVAKSMKISVATVQEIMGDLMTNKQTVFSMLPAFAMFYRRTILVVSETTNTYVEFPSPPYHEETPPIVVYRSKSGRGRGHEHYTLDLADVEVTHRPWVKLESATRPFKSIGNYKISDLEILVNKLGVNVEVPKPKKQDYYTAICKCCETEWQ